jgi:L-threonylcarbamoyladenylate synthase
MNALSFQTAEDFTRSIPRVLDHLWGGGLLAYPTETVYGLGCLLQPHPLQQLAELKGGREGKPFLMLIGSPDHAPGLVWTTAAGALAEHFWPGPLTLALRTTDPRYPPQVVSPEQTVALRVSPHPGLQLLLQQLGEPLTSTSANLPGSPPATTVAELRLLLTNAPVARTLILDGGQLTPRPPSTLVDCSVEPPRVLRPGAVPIEELRRFVHELA